MGYDFDTVVDRQGTDSSKWAKYAGGGVLPLWVADMDFRSPPEVIEALRRRIDHGVFGYAHIAPDLVDAARSMLRSQYGWDAPREWFVWFSGVMAGVNALCRAAGRPGDDVLTLVPIYPPFFPVPRHWEQNLIAVPMAEPGPRWEMDFDRLESAITERTRLLMICNPHNPTGRVFSAEELLRLGEICQRHDLLIASDEIHCGLVLDAGKRHIPIASMSPDLAARTVTLMAPTKTFNLPGVGCSFAVVPNEDLRSRFRSAFGGMVPETNVLSAAAALAAYRDAGPWHAALLDYLRGNRELVEEAVAGTPGLSMAHVEATYLAWIDARALGQQDTAAFFEQAGVGLSDGRNFHLPGFVRLNFGCPRSILAEALRRIRRAVAG